jgi:hypothetical protein
MKKSNALIKLSIYFIKKLHQNNISPHLNKKGIKCRFYPTCSNYGIMALEKYGFIKGWIKTFDRINRCKPNNYDSCVDYP